MHTVNVFMGAIGAQPHCPGSVNIGVSRGGAMGAQPHRPGSVNKGVFRVGVMGAQPHRPESVKSLFLFFLNPLVAEPTLPPLERKRRPSPRNIQNTPLAVNVLELINVYKARDVKGTEV